MLSFLSVAGVLDASSPLSLDLHRQSFHVGVLEVEAHRCRVIGKFGCFRRSRWSRWSRVSCYELKDAKYIQVRGAATDLHIMASNSFVILLIFDSLSNHPKIKNIMVSIYINPKRKESI